MPLRFGTEEMLVQVERYRKVGSADPHENATEVEIAYAVDDLRSTMPMYQEHFLTLCDRMWKEASESGTREALGQSFFEPILSLSNAEGVTIGQIPSQHQLWLCPVESVSKYKKLRTYIYACPLCGSSVMIRSVNCLPQNPTARQLAVVACPNSVRNKIICAESLHCTSY